MRIQGSRLVIVMLLALGLSGCAALSEDPVAGGDEELIEFMLAPSEAPEWVFTPDEGPVEGGSPDCTGAPYEWPDIAMRAYASQFLDRRDETVAVLLKRLDGAASVHIEAARGALEPCAPSSGAVEHGAMVEKVGDDSFAYQTRGEDEFGEFFYSNMVISCGDLLLELSSFDYSLELDQAGLERLVAPVVGRMRSDQDC